MCPVLLLTPDLLELFDWFDGTYELTASGWQRSTLPAEGGYGEQDGALVMRLEYVRGVKQGIWQAKQKKPNV